MNSKVKKIVIIVLCLVILIVLSVIGFFVIKNLSNEKEIEEVKEEDNDIVVDMWEDISLNMDIDLVSSGTGENEMLYLGEQPIHYILKENREIYKYQESSEENKVTGEREPATNEFIKQFTEDDFTILKDKIQKLTKYKKSDRQKTESKYWFIKINGETTRIEYDLEGLLLYKYFKK